MLSDFQLRCAVLVRFIFLLQDGILSFGEHGNTATAGLNLNGGALAYESAHVHNEDKLQM